MFRKIIRRFAVFVLVFCMIFNGSIVGAIGDTVNEAEHILNITAAAVTAAAQNANNAEITLSAEETLQFGTTKQLTAEIVDSDTQPEFVWSSADTDIVTVDENGKLCAIGFGTVTVTVTADYGGIISAECVVTVPEEAINVSDATVGGLEARYEYTGEPITPPVILAFREITLTENKHYTVTYGNAIAPGTARVTVTGIGALQGTSVVTFEIYSDEPITVEEKVDAVYAECVAAGVSGEYETALWLHDWLIYNATYDYTYTEYYADGVLLKGTGVCQSYALAYRLLLDKAGITNQVVLAYEMNHAWNLVYIDGEWCHVDCTWDDPGTGGLENYTYFGMNDELISRDHQWPRDDYAVCTSLDNYYLVRSGGNVFRNLDEFYAVLDKQAQKRIEEIDAYYIGSDSSFNMSQSFGEWYESRIWIYGVNGYSSSVSGYSLKATMGYSDLTTQFTEPVDCPDFTLTGPDGTYTLSDFENNGLILIFGKSTSTYTKGVMNYLYGNLKKLHSDGIEVLVCLLDTASEDDLKTMTEAYPNYRFVYCDYNALYGIFGAAFPDDYSFYLPFTVTIGNGGIINYAYTMFVYDLDGFSAAVNENATDNPISNGEPDILRGDVNGDGTVDETDLLVLTHYLAGWDGVTIGNTDCADVNGDGKITLRDRAVLARYLAGWEEYVSYFAAA